MGESVAILDKVKRNLDAQGIVAVRGQNTVTAAGITISYVDALIQSPMGGVDGTVSPYLGIGIGNPGKLQLKGAAGENTIAGIFVTGDDLRVMAVATRFANNVLIQAGDTTAILAEIAGHPDLNSMGQ